MSKIRQVKIEGTRDDTTLGVVGLTDNNHFKISLEELATALSTNSNTQLKITVYDEAGDAIQINASGNIQVVLNELATAISANGGTQLRTTLYDESGDTAGVTASGNLQISISELVAAISSNSNTQLNVTQFLADGTETGRNGIVNPDDSVTRYAKLDNLYQSLIVTEQTHHHIHDGIHFEAGYVDTSMAASDTFVIAFRTPAVTSPQKRIHMIYTHESLTGNHIQIYKDSTWTTGTGSQIPIYNNRHDIAGSTSGILEDTAGPFSATGNLILDPTGITHGTLTEPAKYNFGSVNNAAGQERGDRERLLEPDTQYTMLFTSDAANNKGQLILDWYELTDE